MWAQIIKSRMKPEFEDQAEQIQRQAEENNTVREGWLRTIVMRDQHNPDEVYTLIVFESEEAARRGEQTPEVQAIAQKMQQLADGPPEFIDLDVLFDRSR